MNLGSFDVIIIKTANFTKPKTLGGFMAKKNTFLLIIFYSMLAGLLWSTDLNVIVKEKNKVISGATVIILEKELQQITKATGEVNFTKLEPGEYTVIVLYPGYKKTSKKISLGKNNQKLFIQLERLNLSLGEITIEEKREKGKVPASKKITGDEIKNTSQTFINDAIKTIQSMPGVSTSGFMFDATMYIQGGDWYENILFLDGNVLINPYKWSGRISMLNPNWIDSIELYTAGYPAYLAQGLSGVIVAKIKEGNREKLKGYFDLSSATSEIGLNGPIGSNVNFYFNIRRTYYELLAPLFMNVSEGVQFPHLTDGILKLTFTPTIDDKISIFLYGSEEGMKWKLTGNVESGEPSYKADFFYSQPQIIFSTRYDRRLTEKDSMDVVLGCTFLSSLGKFDAGPVGVSEWDAKMLTFEGLLNFYINSFDSHKIQSGIATLLPYMIEDKEKSYFYSLDSGGNWTDVYSYEETLSNYLMPYYAGYIMDDWEFINSLIFEAGSRFEYFSPTGEFAVNPVLGLKWEMTEDASIYVRGGRYNRFLFNYYQISEKYGNPELQSEKAYHGLLGIEYDKNAYLVRLEGFYKWYYDLVFNDNDKNFNNDGFREVYGGTLFFQKKKEENNFWSGWISYTYVHGLEKVTNLGTPNPAFPSIIPLDEWYTPAYLREHTLSINLEIVNKIWLDNPWIDWLYNWSISLDFKLMSGKPYTPITNFISQEIPGVGTQYYFFYGKYNSEYTPLYHKLDMKITIPGSPFEFLRLFNLDIESTSYFSFINIYNNENVYDYSYIVSNGELKKTPVKDFSFMMLGGFKVEF